MGEAKYLKVGIYSPYLSILGGGEKYLLDIACILAKKHEVTLFAPPSIREKASLSFRINLDNINILPESVIRTKDIVKKYINLKKFDLFIHMTDGSLLLPVAKKNFLIIQSPAHTPVHSLINRIKLMRWRIICYSAFMKKIINGRLEKNAVILSPSIDLDTFTKNKADKKNIILSVGRFFQYPHNKKHDALIEIFKKNYHKYFQGWKLIITGGLTEEGGKKVFMNLKERVGTYPIDIIANVSFDKLIELYQQAKIYWHATGFGEDIKKYPERTEHFGITTLEAMAGGAVPVVFAAGGQTDVVTDGYNGYLWEKEAELVKKTCRLMQNHNLIKEISSNALSFLNKYSREKFYEQLEKIISE